MLQHEQESSRKPTLVGVVRATLRAKHYSPRTEEAYAGWVRRFIRFHQKRHPRTMGETEVTAFLSSLAVKGHVAASTQNQALSALVFLYREVLGVELDWLQGLVRAKRPERLPVVLTQDEVRRLLSGLSGTVWLMGSLIYGAGLRLLECVELRVKDVDLATRERVRCNCQTRSTGSTRTRRGRSVGSGCFRRRDRTSTWTRGSGAGITSTSRSCSARSRPPSIARAWPSQSHCQQD